MDELNDVKVIDLEHERNLRELTYKMVKRWRESDGESLADAASSMILERLNEDVLEEEKIVIEERKKD